MNKLDAASIRKEFKLDNSRIKLAEVVSIYVKGDLKEIIGLEKEYFDRMETTKQELYLKNFKKLLIGQLDSKVFELEFTDNKLGQNPTQKAFLEILGSEDFALLVEEIALQIIENCTYPGDYMISFTRGEVFKPMRRERGEDEAGLDDAVFSFQFMMGCVNPVTIPKTTLKFDFVEKIFRAVLPLEVMINLASPLDGFMFPSWSDNAADVNHVVYYSHKANNPNLNFIANVLACELHSTAQIEKEQFISRENP